MTFGIRFLSIFLICTLLVGDIFLASTPAYGDEVERLKTEIEQRNNRLLEIQQEISRYKSELQKVGSEKKTLQSAITTLELEQKKINADLRYTENRIDSTDLEISKLNFDIGITERDIERNQDAIREVLRSMDASDKETMVEVLLRHSNLSSWWNEMASLEEVRSAMSGEVKKLISLRVLLEGKKTDQEGKRSQLLGLKTQYADQKSVLANNQTEKSSLLKQTKNKEANYQALIAEKQKVSEQIQKELRSFESQLQFILDPNTIPPPGTPVFRWPVENVIVTQLFGGTEFAKRNAAAYGGRAYHPGVDFGVPRGTKLYAALSGTVRATGNTDAVPGCYSWGKWTLIDHANGLSTLYAHQDLISVTPGQAVKTGDVIGYSGSTGFVTGPHLHFTVYAKAGVSVRKFSEIKTVTNCGAATTPVAATDAYIDPMLYLPNKAEARYSL
jgi:murein DD-endopeptidase MepM/ murein hydrolase activator NlpD